MRVSRYLVAALGLATAPGAHGALAQESASFRIKAPVLNSGGQPLSGVKPASASFALRPDAIGESAVSSSLASATYRLATGFALSFPTPGEVDNLMLAGAAALSWDPEALAGHYHIYRTGNMGAATGLAPVGDCLQSAVTTVTASDPSTPPPGLAFFYFVNAVSCIGVEGPAGSVGVRCP